MGTRKYWIWSLAARLVFCQMFHFHFSLPKGGFLWPCLLLQRMPLDTLVLAWWNAPGAPRACYSQRWANLWMCWTTWPRCWKCSGSVLGTWKHNKGRFYDIDKVSWEESIGMYHTHIWSYIIYDVICLYIWFYICIYIFDILRGIQKAQLLQPEE